MTTTRQPYPSDVSDEEWEFVAPYLCLLPRDYERLADTLVGVHFVAFVFLMLNKAAAMMGLSS